MPELKVGLAPNRTSYFDQITNTYITLSKPVQVVTYTEASELKRITNALLSSKPALVLYEGKIPQEAIDEWESGYLKPFNTNMKRLVRNLSGDMVSPSKTPNRAFDRAEKVNNQSADDVLPLSVNNDQEITLFSTEDETPEVKGKEAPKAETPKDEEVKKEEVKKEEVKNEAEVKSKEEAPKETDKKTSKKASTNKKEKDGDAK